MILNYFDNIYFSQPYFFWLFLLFPILIFWKWKKQSGAVVYLSSVDEIDNTKTLKNSLYNLPFILRLLTLSCIIISLARPQTKNEEQLNEGEGIDIVLCIDVSGSMTSQDFHPNRIEAAKMVATDFVDKRKADKVGLVIFSGESFTQCPLTTDYSVLKSQIAQIRNGLLEDGTSIGAGLATSVDRLRHDSAKSKIIILLTDGVNNGGIIDPNTAKEIAKAFKIKVYTIGVGTDGYAPTPISTPMGIVMQNQKVEIDEKLLMQISSETGGKYYRAKNNQMLQNIYSDIDQLEKSKVEVTTYNMYAEKFFPFVFAAMFFLFLEILLKFTVFRKFP